MALADRKQAEKAIRLALRFEGGLNPDHARYLAKVAMGRLSALQSEAQEDTKCGATFSGFDLGAFVADLLICDEPRGHAGAHHDTVARKAWQPFLVPPCDPPVPVEEDNRG